MPIVQQFAYGPVNPLVAFLMAYIGSVLGLTCASRARTAASRSRRVRWLALASIGLGGAGAWLMQFMATLGFDIPSRTIRYDGPLTIVSLLIAIAAVGGGVFIVGWRRVSVPRILLGALVTGVGLAAMHYTGLAAIDFDGHLRLARPYLIGSLILALAVAAVMLWCTVSIRGWKAIGIASALIAAGLCAMHYLGMSGIRARVEETGPGRPSHGVDPTLVALPVAVVTTVVLMMALLFGALSMMTDEEFAQTGDFDGRRAAPTRPVPRSVAAAHGYTHGAPPDAAAPHVRAGRITSSCR